MRFPDIPFMKSIFWLFKNEQSPINGKLELIDYHLDNNSNLNMFNGITLTAREKSNLEKSGVDDPFQTGTGPPANVSACITETIGKYKDSLKVPDKFAENWERMMNTIDDWSTRQYMHLAPEGPKYHNRVNKQSASQTKFTEVPFEGH